MKTEEQLQKHLEKGLSKTDFDFHQFFNLHLPKITRTVDKESGTLPIEYKMSITTEAVWRFTEATENSNEALEGLMVEMLQDLAEQIRYVNEIYKSIPSTIK